MLSNVSIKQYLQSKDISITPWDDEMLGSNRINLHLGTRLLLPQPGTVIDVKDKKLPDYKEITLSEDKPYLLQPNEFVLGETYEKIGISEKIGMLIDGRSTIARFGITVIQTAMIIDSGQQPKLMTLEIKNNGNNPVHLYPKMKFCKAIFFLLTPPATIRYDTDGKYLADDPLKPVLKDEFKKGEKHAVSVGE